ncbi:MAG: hypothetical protein WCO03_01955 [bacterium]
MIKKTLNFIVITLLVLSVGVVVYPEPTQAATTDVSYVRAQYYKYVEELKSLLRQLIQLKESLALTETSQTASSTATSTNATSSVVVDDTATSSVVIKKIEDLIARINGQASSTEQKITDLYDNYDKYQADYSEALNQNQNAANQGLNGNNRDQVAKSLASQGVSPNDVANNTAAFKRAMENYQEDTAPGSLSEGSTPSGGYVGTAQPEAGYKEGENTGEAIPWRKVSSSLMTRGVGEADVTDICSGKKFRVRRTGGSNHADVEPVTAADTKEFNQMKHIPSWSGRPVIATMRNGSKVAAAIRPFPHSYDRIGSNGMQGHFDLYFKNSVGHASPNPGNYPNPMMQANVELATKGKCN